MKKILFFVIAFMLIFTISCSKNNKTTFTLDILKDDVNLEVEEVKGLVFTDSYTANDFVFTYDKEIISVEVDDQIINIKALKEGSTKLVITTSKENYEGNVSINVNVKRPKEMVGTVEFGKVLESMTEGDTATITYTTLSKVTATWKTSDKNVLTVNDGELTAVKAGKATITLTLTTLDDSYIKTWEITVVEKDKTEPVLSVTGDKDIKILWGKDFDPLADVTAIDNVDGDITNKIQVTNPVDTKTNGKYVVKYEVTDEAGNKATLERNVEVYWGYAVKFIGHAGSFFGAQNSLESCEYALKELKYQALECDLKRTKDGVFVCCHNDALNGTDGKSYTIANYTLAQLQALTFKEKRSGLSALAGVEDKTYEFKVMTLEDYLLICKKYNAVPIIELKGCAGVSQSDQSGMPALMQLIKDCGVLDSVVFLASAYNCLIWTRNNGYSDIKCQYLMSTCNSETRFNLCVQYHFDLSICVTYGDYTDTFTAAQREEYKQQWIRRYQDAGCEVSVWTFTQYCTYEQVQEWIDFGVDWLTCDWQQMDKLKLYEDTTVTHKVTFLKNDGSILKEVTVKDGKSAYVPAAPEITDHEFQGWDTDTTKVTTDLTVKPIYIKIAHKYNISYELNGGYWDLDPRATGESVGSVDTTKNTGFWNNEGYKTEVFLIAHDTYSTDKALYAHRVYLKHIKGAYYEVVNVGKSGSAHYDKEFDFCIEVSDQNKTPYSTLNTIMGKIVDGDIALINGDTSTGVATVTFYTKENVAGLVVENYTDFYTTEMVPYTLPVPNYEGKTFVGWSLSQDGSNPITVIPTGLEQDLELFAVYE